jgi:hypothetical protein
MWLPDANMDVHLVQTLNDKARAAQLEEFRSEMDRRLASLDRGEAREGETVFAEIREKSEQRRRQRA